MKRFLQQRRDRVAIISRWSPASGAITAHEADQLATRLGAHLGKANVEMICASGHYGTSHARRTDAQDRYTTRILRAGPVPAGALPRLLHSIILGIRLAAIASLRARVIVTQTDPPLVGLWVGIFAAISRSQWVDWTMDLYPDAFIAAGFVSHRSIAVRMLNHLRRWTAADACFALGDRQLQFLRKQGRCRGSAVVLPCGTTRAASPSTSPHDLSEEVFATYAGNLGEAHDCDRVAAFVDGLLSAGRKVLLAPSGSKAEWLTSRFNGRVGVTLAARASRDELSRIPIHIVSLNAQWTHICVPSKAVTAACLTCFTVFLGPQESDISTLAGPHSLLVPPSTSLAQIVEIGRALGAVGAPPAPQAAAEHASSLLAAHSEALGEAADIVASLIPAR